MPLLLSRYSANTQTTPRSSPFKDAVVPLEKAMELSQEVCTPPFFLAMSRWHLGAKEQACAEFRTGGERMEKLKREEATLLSLRAEAATLLGVSYIPPKKSAK